MTMKPRYRVKMAVYDSETEEEVCHEDEPLMSFREDALDQATRLLRRFDTFRSNFEETYYPNKQEKHEEEILD